MGGRQVGTLSVVVINKTAGDGWVAVRWGRGGRRGDALRVRADAFQAQFWVENGPARTPDGHDLSLERRLGHHFCPRRPKRTRADEMGRPIGVALSYTFGYARFITLPPEWIQLDL